MIAFAAGVLVGLALAAWIVWGLLRAEMVALRPW